MMIMNTVVNFTTVVEVNNNLAKELTSRVSVDTPVDYTPALTNHIVNFDNLENPIEKILPKKYWNHYKNTTYKHLMKYDLLRSDFKKFLKDEFNITKENFSQIIYK